MADEKLENLRVWTSLLKRTIQTTVGIDAPKEHWKALNEIDAVSDDVLMYICTCVLSLVTFNCNFTFPQTFIVFCLT